MTIRRNAAFAVTIAYVWVMMIMLGALVLETFMVYPNIFHDPPESLMLAQEFLSVSGPNTFFRPLGMLLVVSGAAALLLGWTIRLARIWLALSLLMIVADGVVSILFFWPRNQIMFVEGLDLHTAEALRRTAEEFVTMHWLRLALNAASAVFGFIALYALIRWRLSQPAKEGLPEEWMSSLHDRLALQSVPDALQTRTCDVPTTGASLDLRLARQIRDP